MMTTIEQIKRKLGVLENTSPTTDQKVMIEKRGDMEFVRWGKLIVKMIRGVSTDDL